ncbi:MAG TPA: hypothetical protein VIT91_17585 [Chthoniobacterales bacterium]
MNQIEQHLRLFLGFTVIFGTVFSIIIGPRLSRVPTRWGCRTPMSPLSRWLLFSMGVAWGIWQIIRATGFLLL